MAAKGTKEIQPITGKNESQKQFLRKIFSGQKKPISSRDKQFLEKYKKTFIKTA